jgi:hypothetical protein
MNKIVEQFTVNVESVNELANFDRVVLDFAIHLVSSLKNVQGSNRLQINATENAAKALQNVRDHDSLRPKYQAVFNQCLVLLVSYFGSTINNLFNSYLTEFLKLGLTPISCKKEEIKVSFSDLETLNYDVLGNIGELVVSSKNISFQDMQSIARAFRDWLGHEPNQDQDVNNIIVGQACRHVIVHFGGVVNKRLLFQIRNAIPRDLKLNFVENELLQFSPDGIKVVGNSMIRYVEKLSNELDSRLPVSVNNHSAAATDPIF